MGATEALAVLLEAPGFRGLVNAEDGTSDGRWTPLHYAAHEGQRDAARLLEEAGADPSARDSDGWTPAQRAAMNMGKASVL